MLQTRFSPTPTTSVVPARRTIRALLLDDSNFDRARIRRLSKKTELPIQLDEVDSIAQMDRAVARSDYDLVLIDYRLPVGDGLQAVDHILQSTRNRAAGKIMITGDNARQTAIDAMRVGCHDFLAKEEMDVDALRQAMLNALRAARHQDHMLDADTQKEIIRQGLVAAMQDREVQGNVISIVQRHMKQLHVAGLGPSRAEHQADFDALLAQFGEDDDFVFH